ncbi:MAG: tail fiber domain-containing protein [Bacteroidales bacterium]|nr:tail fiber domain-containing protein [Bacteroidales bacterium]
MNPSAIYYPKYRFEFISDNGNEFCIDICKRDYSGVVISRSLGRSPVLKRDKSDGGILGTSLEIYAECQSDGEFAELYTSDAREYFVMLRKKRNSTYDTIWTGFISPELYSEPDIAPPYDVQIIATDGIGELKLYDFAAAGRQSLLAHIKACLANIGQTIYNTDIISVNEMEGTSPSISKLHLLAYTYIDLDNYAGQSCYDVLSAIMASLNAKITLQDNRWLIIRENDEKFSNYTVPARDGSGTAVSLPLAEFGSMDSTDWWPVGHLESIVMPAKNRVEVTSNIVKRLSMLSNPELETLDEWQKQGAVQMTQLADIRRPALSADAVTTRSILMQELLVAAQRSALTLDLGLLCPWTSQNTAARAHVRVTSIGTSTEYLKINKDGTTSWLQQSTINTIDLQKVESPWYISGFTSVKITLPGIQAGTLRVEIIADYSAYAPEYFYVGWAYLTQNTPAGFKDAVAISNGARDKADGIEIAFADAPYTANALANICNLLTNSSGVLITSWKTGRITTARNYLDNISVDYALTNAAVRLKYSGRINVPLLTLQQGGVPIFYCTSDTDLYLAETISWDLLHDELEVSLIQRPTAASITVDSIKTSEIIPSQSGSGSGSSGSGGGTGGVSTYADLPDKPRINGHTLTGNQTAAQLGLIGSGNFKLESLDDVSLTSPSAGSILYWYQNKWHNNNNWVMSGTALLPTGSNGAVGSEEHPLAQAVTRELRVPTAQSGEEIRIVEYNGVPVIGHFANDIQDGGFFISDYALQPWSEDDQLGTADNPWFSVYANKLKLHDGISIETEAAGNTRVLDIIGVTHFFGGGFLPMPLYQGSAVTKTLGNLYFWWNYAFVENVILHRGTDNVNRGFSWYSGGEEMSEGLRANADIILPEYDITCRHLYQSSDRRLKENIEEMDGREACKVLSELRPVNFDWKSNGNAGHGFIAQDVEDVVADLVREKADGRLALDYTGIISFLVKGWQMQQAQISALEKELESLRLGNEKYKQNDEHKF